MSEANIETVRRMYAWVETHTETCRELVTPDYQVDASEIAPEGSWPRDYDGAEEILREYWTTFEDFHFDEVQVIHADDAQVVTTVVDGGRLRGSTQELMSRYFHVWGFRDGKVASVSIHTDRARALEAAGLAQ